MERARRLRDERGLPPGHARPAALRAHGALELLRRRALSAAARPGDGGPRRARARRAPRAGQGRRQAGGDLPLPDHGGAPRARPRALRDLLRALPRPRRLRRGHGRAARHEAAAQPARPAPARRAARLLLRRRHARLRRDDRLRRPHRARGSLGHRGLRARAAAQPERHARRRAAHRARRAGEGPVSAPTPLSSGLARLQRTGFGIALAGGALSAWGYAQAPERFLHAYLIGWLFWLGPTLGSLAVVMLHNTTGGGWGFAIKRLLEGGMRNLPAMALLFLPIALGIHGLYEWSHAEAVASDPLLQHKAAWLNPAFFLARTVAYFAAWIGLAAWLGALAGRYDRTLEVSALRRMQLLSGLGLVLYVATMSFASFDWAMSLEPHWFS